MKFGKNFRRKVRYIAEVYNELTPSSTTYISVVYQDYIHIQVLAADLNDLD